MLDVMAYFGSITENKMDKLGKIAINTADELLKVIEYAQQHQKLDAQWHIYALHAVNNFKEARRSAYDGNS